MFDATAVLVSHGLVADCFQSNTKVESTAVERTLGLAMIPATKGITGFTAPFRWRTRDIASIVSITGLRFRILLIRQR